MTTLLSALNIKLSTSEKRALIVELKEAIKHEVSVNKSYKMLMRAEKAQAAADRAAAREVKKAEKIAALEAKLHALKNPVGSKAIKANKKPGKVTTLQVEAAENNAIALKFAAKKKSV